MKKVLSALLTILLVVSISGCQNNTPDESKGIETTYNTFGEFDGAEYKIENGELYGRYRNSMGLFGKDKTEYFEEWTKININANNIIHLEICSGILLYLTSDGKVYVLGDIGELEKLILFEGDTTDYITTPVLLFVDCKTVSLGVRFALFLKNDNTLWFVGESLNGQSTQVKEVVLEPSKIADNVLFAKAFGYTSSWIDSEYNLYLCGDNSYGQIGNGKMGCGYPTMFKDIVEEPFCALKGCACFSVEQSYNGILSVYAETEKGESYTWGGEYGATPVLTNESNTIFNK